MGSIKYICGPAESGMELGNMYMGPLGNISGLTGHGMGLGYTTWGPFGFSYRGATCEAHVGWLNGLH